jgi:hypothetical protein
MNENIIIRLRQSSLRTFRQCARKYKLAHIDRLAPKVKPIALSVGCVRSTPSYRFKRRLTRWPLNASTFRP